MQKIAFLTFTFVFSIAYALDHQELVRNRKEIQQLQTKILKKNWQESYKLGMDLMQRSRDPGYVNVVADLISQIPQKDLDKSYISTFFSSFEAGLYVNKNKDSELIEWRISASTHKQIDLQELYLFSPSFGMKIFDFKKDCEYVDLKLLCRFPWSSGYFGGNALFNIHMRIADKPYVTSFVLFDHILDWVGIVWTLPQEGERISSEQISYSIQGLDDKVRNKYDFYEFAFNRSGSMGKTIRYQAKDFKSQGKIPKDLLTGYTTLKFTYQKAYSINDFQFVFNKTESKNIDISTFQAK